MKDVCFLFVGGFFVVVLFLFLFFCRWAAFQK